MRSPRKPTVIMEVTDAPDYDTTALIPRRSALDNCLNVPIARPARVFHTHPLPTAECHVCSGLTPWRCWTCERPTCASCAVSMYALCQACRAAYTGPINALQKQSDVYITAEFERMFV